jgi:hypothetical protein
MKQCEEEAPAYVCIIKQKKWIEIIMEVYELYRGGTQELVTSAIEDVTGKKPTTFAQFAKDYAEAFK